MKENLFDYMSRHLEEYRKMKPELVVPMQKMFPGCHKYSPCCDAHWNQKLENLTEHEREYLKLLLDEKSYRYWTNNEHNKNNKPPKNFDKW